MVPRYALRKLSFPLPPVPTHDPHTERDERDVRRGRANGVDAGATPPPGIRRKWPRRSAPAAALRTAPNGVEPFRDLHSIWSAEGSQGTKTTSMHRPRAATVEPPVAPSGRAIGPDCRQSKPARRGLTCDVQACGRVSRGGGGKRPRRAVARCW
jgi:hypothetical protein